MQGKARQSLRMQLEYNMIIQFKFQALRRFFRYHGCMLNGIVPLNRNVHRTHFLSSNFRHSASLALSQSANLQLKKLPLTAHFLNWQSDSTGQFKLSINLEKSLQQLTNQHFKHNDSVNENHVSSIMSAGI